MQKIACVFSFKESSWVSCQKIVFNLHKAYELAPDYKLENINYPHYITEFSQAEESARKILHFDPDIISIMDHRPHPQFLFQALAALYKNRKKPKIIFHLFGDFTLYYTQWENLSPLLEGYLVEFIVASERQKILVDKMFKANKNLVCPFPVNPEEFYFSPELREIQRLSWGLKESDVAFLFTGRLSRQKRISTLIATFAQALGSKPKAHLFIYGHPDEIGDPFLGKYEIEGEYFRNFYSVYKALPELIQQRIHFMGSVPNSELLSVYNGADILTNLSVHNDEDYGMSVAEAQFCGLPSMLTDWGGLASFAHPKLGEATTFIPVKITQINKKICRTQVLKAFNELFTNPHQNIRPKLAELARGRFGLEAASGLIHKAIQKKSSSFGGYTELFKQASMAHAISAYKYMYLDNHLYINDLYKNIYSSYVRNNS
jgi:glycosyltransferase involved in cell wall biosynthesis